MARMGYCGRCGNAVAMGSASCPTCGMEISRTPPAAKAPVVEVAVSEAVVEAPPRPVMTDALTRELMALVTENRVIEAIKIYRERMNVGLKEAKDAVDAMRANR